jgi:hypothetical protein
LKNRKKGKNRLTHLAQSENPVRGQAAGVDVRAFPPHLCLSFAVFDPTQGQTFEHWSENGLLLKAMHRWREQCRKSIKECLQEKRFSLYGRFPAMSEFKHPHHIPPDAEWASMHLQGEPCVIGHVIGNVFYVVFFDEEHKFWPVQKKHT